MTYDIGEGNAYNSSTSNDQMLDDNTPSPSPNIIRQTSDTGSKGCPMPAGSSKNCSYHSYKHKRHCRKRL